MSYTGVASRRETLVQRMNREWIGTPEIIYFGALGLNNLLSGSARCGASDTNAIAAGEDGEYSAGGPITILALRAGSISTHTVEVTWQLFIDGIHIPAFDVVIPVNGTSGSTTGLHEVATAGLIRLGVRFSAGVANNDSRRYRAAIEFVRKFA